MQAAGFPSLPWAGLRSGITVHKRRQDTAWNNTAWSATAWKTLCHMYYQIRENNYGTVPPHVNLA